MTICKSLAALALALIECPSSKYIGASFPNTINVESAGTGTVCANSKAPEPL